VYLWLYTQSAINTIMSKFIAECISTTCLAQSVAIWRQDFTQIRFMLYVLANRCHLWTVHRYNSLNTTTRLLISPAICVLVCVRLHFTAVNCIFIVLYAALVNPLFETVRWLQKIQTCGNKFHFFTVHFDS
jgi:hypothetical protein